MYQTALTLPVVGFLSMNDGQLFETSSSQITIYEHHDRQLCCQTDFSINSWV